MPDGTGDDLDILIGGDITPLQNAFDQMTAAAQSAASAVNAALASGSQGPDGLANAAKAAAAQLGLFGEQERELAAQIASGTQQLDLFGSQFYTFDAAAKQVTQTVNETTVALNQIKANFEDQKQAVADAAAQLQLVHQAYQDGAASAGQLSAAQQELAAKLRDLNGPAQETASSFRDMGSALLAVGAALAITAGLETFAEDALKAYSAVEQFTVSLTALSGSAASAEAALKGIEQIALTQPFSFPELATAAQRLAAFGTDVSAIPGILESAANAAAATGNAFSSVAQAIGRVEETGTISARQFVQLGINVQDIANTMGVTVAQAATLMKKNAMDAATDVDVLITTINNKFGGMAGTMATTISGQFQVLKNQLEAIMQTIGDTLAPFARSIMDLVQSDLIPWINGVILGFQQMAPLWQEIAIGAAAILASIGPVAVALGGVGLALSGLGVAAAVLGPIAAGLGAIAVTITLVKFSGLTDALLDFGRAFNQTFPGVKQGVSDLAGYVDHLAVSIDNLPSMKGWLLDFLGPLGQVTQGLQLMTAAMDSWNGRSVEMETASRNVASNLGIAAAGLSQEAQAAIAAGNAASAAYLKQQAAAALAKAAAEAAAKAAQKWNDTWQTAAQRALDGLADMESGEKSAESEISALSSAIETASLHWDQMSKSSKAAFVALHDGLDEARAKAIELAQLAEWQKLVDNLGDIEEKADELAVKVPADFQAMLSGVANGQNFSGLEKSLTDTIAKMRSDMAALGLESDETSQDIVAGFQAQLDSLHQMNEALKLVGQDTHMDKLASEINGVVARFEAGDLSSAQFAQAARNLAADLDSKVIPAMQNGAAMTNPLTEALKNLAAAGGPDFAAKFQAGIDVADVSLKAFGIDAKAAAQSVDAALKDLGVNSLDALSTNLTRYGADIVSAFKGITDASDLSTAQFQVAQQAVLKWAADVLPAVQTFGTSFLNTIPNIEAVLTNIAKISPALVAAIKQGPDAFAAAFKAMSQDVAIGVMSDEQAYKNLGITSTQTYDNLLDLQTASYNKLVAIDAPIQAQLTGLADILQTQVKIAVATGQSAEVTLEWVEQLEAVKIKQDLLKEDSAALGELYTSTLKAMNAGWNELGKNLADAIVSGQDFGKAFTKALVDIKKSLMDLVVNYLMGELKRALLENTDALSSFNKLFNGIFGAGGIIAPTLQQTQEQILAAQKAMTDAMKATSDAVSKLSQSTTAGVQQVSNAALQSLSSIFSMVTGAITAIAAIIEVFQLNHLEHVMGQVETNTRYAWMVLGGAGAETIFGYVKLESLAMTAYLKWAQTTMQTVLIQMNGDLDAIAANTGQMVMLLAAGGLGGGSGGDGSGAAAIIAAIQELTLQSRQTQVLGNQFINNGNRVGELIDNAAGTLSTNSALVNYSAQTVTAAADAVTTASDKLSAASATVAAAATKSDAAAATNAASVNSAARTVSTAANEVVNASGRLSVASMTVATAAGDIKSSLVGTRANPGTDKITSGGTLNMAGFAGHPVAIDPNGFITASDAITAAVMQMSTAATTFNNGAELIGASALTFAQVVGINSALPGQAGYAPGSDMLTGPMLPQVPSYATSSNAPGASGQTELGTSIWGSAAYNASLIPPAGYQSTVGGTGPTTVQFNITGNQITSQKAADDLASTIVLKLRQVAGLKL